VDGKFTGSCVHERTAQLSHRHRRHDEDLADRRLRYYWRTDSLDGNLHVPRGAIPHADTDGHGNGNCNSNGDINTNCYGYGYTYAYLLNLHYPIADTDGHGNRDCNSDSYAYTDSYANRNS